MQILITGGTGFIGRQLCSRLQATGHHLTVLSRQPAERVRQLCGAVKPLTSLAQLNERDCFDAVVNLAGEAIIGPRWSKQRKQALWESRVALTRELVGWMAGAEQKPEVLISGSAVGYYGDQGERLLEENAPPVEQGFGQELCAAWEAAAREAEALGVRVCVLRTGPVLGRDGGMLQRMLLPFRLGLGGPIGDGRQWLAWIHIEDHLRMIEALLEAEAMQGSFNASAPSPVTSKEFAQVLGRALRRPAMLPAPAWLLKLAMGEQAEILLGSQRAVPVRFEQVGFEFRYPELQTALEEILD
ncbi:TIGR01777 family oxidoreductase [Thiolapillus sp.]